MAGRFVRHAVYVALAAVLLGAALAFDFSMAPPHALLALCGSALRWNEQGALWIAHVRGLPVSGAFMLGWVLVESRLTVGRWQALHAALSACLMLAVMLLTMQGLHALWQVLDRPWTATPLAAAMILGMVLHHLLHRMLAYSAFTFALVARARAAARSPAR